MLALDGHESRQSVDYETYCNDDNRRPNREKSEGNPSSSCIPGRVCSERFSEQLAGLFALRASLMYTETENSNPAEQDATQVT